jgi:hypothetical protein
MLNCWTSGGLAHDQAAREQLEHFSQYYELSNGGYEQLSLAESCANFCGFGLHLCEKCFTREPVGRRDQRAAVRRFGSAMAAVGRDH